MSPGIRVSEPRRPGVGACLLVSGPAACSLRSQIQANSCLEVLPVGTERNGREFKTHPEPPHAPSWFQLYNFLNILQPSWHWGPRGAGQRSRPGERGLTKQTHVFTFISASGAGASLARGKSNRTAVMIRAPRNTKTAENQWPKDRGLKAPFRVGLRLAFPWGPYSASVH